MKRQIFKQNPDAKMLADAESQLAAAKAAFREAQKAQTP